MEIKIPNRLIIENELISIRKSIRKIDSELLKLMNEDDEWESQVESLIDKRLSTLAEPISEVLKDYLIER